MTFDEFRILIRMHTGHPEENIGLFYAGKANFEGDYTLGDYKIRKDSTFFLLPRRFPGG